MKPLLDSRHTRWLGTLSRWALVNGLVMLGVLGTFAIIMASSQTGVLPPEYDELVWAAQLPGLYRVATTLDIAGWLALGGFFVVAANSLPHTPIRSTLIAACGVGQLAGAIGAFSRLVGVSALAAQYRSAALDQQPALLRSFVDLQLVINAHFGVGSLLWSVGLLLIGSAAWPARSFPRWLASLLALTGACNLTGDLIGIVGGPLPFARFILPLLLLTASLFSVAAVSREHRAVFPASVGTSSHPSQERAS